MTNPETEHHRPDDGPVTITRAIPLTWVLSVLAAIVAQAAVVYFTQQRQGELLQAMAIELKQVSTTVSNSGTKDVEHDFRLADHERRLQALERKP